MGTTTPGRVLGILERAYPEARCGLAYADPFQLLIATILSAQCTDARVNLITPGLFRRYPTPAALARARPRELERIIHSAGFYRQKAAALRACARALEEEHGGEVPRDREALVRLQGVGRKTANVVLNEAYGVPAIAVDTHVLRTSRRLGWIDTKDPLKAERRIMEKVPKRWWRGFTLLMIHHGRNRCTARKPDCPGCPVLRHCPHGEGVTSSGASSGRGRG